MSARAMLGCWLGLWAFGALGALGCDAAMTTGATGRACRSGAQCPSGVCRDGRCVEGVSDGGRTDAGPPEPGCVDGDGDRFGPGCSRGPDCDDTNPLQTGVETCDMQDNDCDGVADNGVLNACGNCDATCMGGGIGAGTGMGFDPAGDDSDGVGVDPTDGALVLDSTAIDTHIIWLANTAEGTVSKVDTRTYTELARYATGPSGGGNDPSRTSVNGAGDVYVGNRGGGTVSKISALGAMCPDTNGDGVVTTSSGPTDVLAWGQDDCVLWNTRLSGSGLIRAVAAQDVEGPDGEIRPFVWAGGWGSRAVYKLDGVTGEMLFQTPSPTNTYGFALDAVGNLWISGRSDTALGRIDTTRCVDAASCTTMVCGAAGDDCIKQAIPTPSNPYGITVDFMQRVWFGGDAGATRYDPMAPAGARFSVVHWSFVHGIAADAVGWVWGAGAGSGVIRISAADPASHAVVAGTGGHSNKGMAVDQDGKIWSITYEGDATIVTPGATLDAATVVTGQTPVGSLRYTYSDMTGLQLRLATNPRGYYTHVFEGCDPATSVSTDWGDLSWDGDVPPGTTLRFRVRTAATAAELAGATWVTVADVPPDASPASVAAKLAAAGVMSERFLEVRVELASTRSSTREVVTPRVRSFAVTRMCPPIFG